jgi:hypothetical protein
MLQAKQERRRYPSKPKINLLPENKEERKIARRNRVKSQGLDGIKPRNKIEIEEPLPPIPLTVREEEHLERDRKNSELNIDMPDNEFE